MKTRLGWPGYWCNGHLYGADGMLPVHLYPFPVTKTGYGPADGADYDHDICWCDFDGCMGDEDEFGFPRG